MQVNGFLILLVHCSFIQNHSTVVMNAHSFLHRCYVPTCSASGFKTPALSEYLNILYNLKRTTAKRAQPRIRKLSLLRLKKEASSSVLSLSIKIFAKRFHATSLQCTGKLFAAFRGIRDTKIEKSRGIQEKISL